MSEWAWWWVALAALLFWWLAGDVELAGWAAMAWVGGAIWNIYNSPTPKEKFELSGQYTPGTITDVQLDRIIRLCHKLNREPPKNLADMSAAEARLFISEMTGEEVGIDY